MIYVIEEAFDIEKKDPCFESVGMSRFVTF
jgi:hypothetical protein